MKVTHATHLWVTREENMRRAPRTTTITRDKPWLSEHFFANTTLRPNVIFLREIPNYQNPRGLFWQKCFRSLRSRKFLPSLLNQKVFPHSPLGVSVCTLSYHNVNSKSPLELTLSGLPIPHTWEGLVGRLVGVGFPLTFGPGTL